MYTSAAAKFDDADVTWFHGVASRAELAAIGVGADDIAAQVHARRWQTRGQAVVLHNAEPDRSQRERIALIRCGPRTVLTSFTGAAIHGLTGWEREEIHVLGPAGTRDPRIREVVLHRCGRWRSDQVIAARRLHRLEPSLVIAAASFPGVRPACGLMAAAVQQRLTDPAALRGAVERAPRTRHRAALLCALDDIAQGAQALSEIDFARLCRSAGLPEPYRQAVRVEPSGRRRYLDVEWRLPSGKRVVVEVDGALHLKPKRWYDDQLRQNEVVIGGASVLRYPSVVVRHESWIVLDQLRRILV